MFLYMFSNIHPYLSLLFSHFVFLFSPSFFTLLTTRHILLFTVLMFDSISLQPAYNITEIRKTLYSSWQKKKCHINYNQNKCSKYMVQSMSFSSLLFHILINILFCDKKNILTIFHTETYHRTANNIWKSENNMF